MAGLIRRIAVRQVVPGRACSEDPQYRFEDRPRRHLRTPATIGATFRYGEMRLDQCPLLVGEVHRQLRSQVGPSVDQARESDRNPRT